MSGTFGYSLSNNSVFNDIPFQPFLNDLVVLSDTSGIPFVMTRAEYFTTQSTYYTIGNAPITTTLTAADYAANPSGFKNSQVQIAKEVKYTQINLAQSLGNNLMTYRTKEGGYNKSAVMAICDFVGAALAKTYIEQNIMANLQANIVAQMTGYTSNYVTELSGLIDWTLTDATPPAGQTKIIDYLNTFYALFPSEMKQGGVLGGYIVGYVSQNDFKTMLTSLNSAYQFQTTGGFEQGKNVWNFRDQLSLKDVQVRNANTNYAHILFANIMIMPLIEMSDDTLLLTYQKVENEAFYYEKVPAANKQNLYFGMSGNFTYQPELIEPIYKLTESPFSLPLSAGGVFLCLPDPYNLLLQNLGFYMGTCVVIQDPSRFFGLFPN